MHYDIEYPYYHKYSSQNFQSTKVPQPIILEGCGLFPNIHAMVHIIPK